ncbi:hypothetical protein BC828DRAFT_143805 [Blastocladiella britannica]|nr:hypothetical protein BC828DRAFT_143805 [Blastocladiella britannica]
MTSVQITLLRATDIPLPKDMKDLPMDAAYCGTSLRVGVLSGSAITGNVHCARAYGTQGSASWRFTETPLPLVGTGGKYDAHRLVVAVPTSTLPEHAVVFEIVHAFRVPARHATSGDRYSRRYLSTGWAMLSMATAVAKQTTHTLTARHLTPVHMDALPVKWSKVEGGKENLVAAISVATSNVPDKWRAAASQLPPGTVVPLAAVPVVSALVASNSSATGSATAAAAALRVPLTWVPLDGTDALDSGAALLSFATQWHAERKRGMSASARQADAARAASSTESRATLVRCAALWACGAGTMFGGSVRCFSHSWCGSKFSHRHTVYLDSAQGSNQGIAGGSAEQDHGRGGGGAGGRRGSGGAAVLHARVATMS